MWKSRSLQQRTYVEYPSRSSATLANEGHDVEFFAGLLQSHPIVPTSSTPVYSNAAFQILAYALEAMTHQSYEELLQRDIIEPLGLSGTYYTTPNISLGVVPNDGGEHWWNFDLGDEGP
jgi:CubicO group peptidase (beta-lactamase class C family)